jgi:hypothetical protein
MRRSLFVVPLIALAPGLLGAQQGPGAETFRIQYEEETLPNGLRVIYRPPWRR